jgi:hypothetical protein
MSYIYEYAEDNLHKHCHKIEVTTFNDLRLGRRAYIDQRCEECRAEIDETDLLRAEIAGLRAELEQRDRWEWDCPGCGTHVTSQVNSRDKPTT